MAKLTVTTELERRLLGVIGGFMGVTAQTPDIAEIVFRAAEVTKKDVDDSLGGLDHFNCTMWNLCNNSIGSPMLTHEEIREIRANKKTKTDRKN